MIYNGLNKEKPIKEIKAKNDKEVIEVYGGVGEEKPIYYKEETLTGTPPFYFKALGQPIKNWTITGSSDGVGEKTANLAPPIATWNSGFVNVRGDINGQNSDVKEKISSYIEVDSNKTYTFSYETGNFPNDGAGTWVGVGLYDENHQFIQRLVFTNDIGAMPIITTDKTKYLRLSFRTYGETLNTMLNIGNILSYEPYGYKIPVICGGETTNIYLLEPLGEGEQITSEQTEISIPTTVGENLLLINTTVQPTEVSFTNYLRPKEQTDFTPPTDFETIQALVRSNAAKDYFTVHESQIITTKDNDNLTWDILGINHDTPTDSKATHSMTLQMHNHYPLVMQGDAPEAFYYCENGLAVGTYYFTIDSTYEPSINDLSAYQFMLTKDVPAGGQLTFPWRSGKASDVKVNSFASRTSTTAIEQVSVIEGTDGQNLGNLTIVGDFSNNLNSIHRVRYGSNNYKESAIRQWLNSDKPAGSVWTPQTKFDRPPSWAATTAGFMHGMDSDFLAAIGKTHIIAIRNRAGDGGGYDEMDDYFFLLSRDEVYMGSEPSSYIPAGRVYPFYSDYSDLSAPGIGADSNRIKELRGSAQWWGLRTPDLWSATGIRDVSPTGAIHTNTMVSVGIAPACNII